MKATLTSQPKSRPIDLPWRRGRRLLSFFQNLQWKLTIAYTLFTLITILILGIVGLALIWYLTFWSNLPPHQIADGLIKASPVLTPYLAQTPPNQEGLNNWLQRVIVGDDLVINIPKKEGTADEVPGQFGQLVAIAIVDRQGKVLVAAPDKAVKPGVELASQLSPDIVAGFQAALRGELNPEQISTRAGDGSMVASAPIFGPNQEVLGAIFVRTVFPIEESEFVKTVFQGTILPVALAMVTAGVIAGLLFGFFIARGFTRRLHGLDKVADEWSRGNFEALADDPSGDELGQLARQLNHMAMQLQNLMQTRQELATLEERNRLARDLHDSVKQQIFATAMQVGAARVLLAEQPDKAAGRLQEAEVLVHQAQQELTSLIRELRPAALEGKGLVVALRDYVADWSRQNQIPAEVRVQGERPLPLVVEQTLFRIAQEALANISRHSAATQTEIHLVCQAEQVTLTISDNGQGFPVGATNGKGVGLRSMRERVESLGGRLTIESEPARGTRIAAQLTTR